MWETMDAGNAAGGSAAVADLDVLQQFAAVLFVFLLLGAVVWKLRAGRLAFAAPWSRMRNGPAAIQCVERVALTPQHTLHLVRVEGRVLVVATHPAGCSLLMEREEPPR